MATKASRPGRVLVAFLIVIAGSPTRALMKVHTTRWPPKTSTVSDVAPRKKRPRAEVAEQTTVDT